MSETIEGLGPSAQFGLQYLDSEKDKKSEYSITYKELGKSYYLLAKVLYDKSDLIEAEKNFIKALEFTQTPVDCYSILKIYGFLIRIASEKLENEKAQLYIQKAKELVNNLSTKLGSLGSEYFYNLGIIENYSGNFSQAKENFLMSYKKSKEENEPEILSKCLLALAILYYNGKNYKTAIEYLVQLDELLKIINKTYLRGSMYYYLGKIYIEIEEYELAQKNLQMANKTLQEKKCWNLHGYLLLSKGIVHKKLGEFEKALVYFNYAIDSTDPTHFKRLFTIVRSEIQDVNDESVDIYLDRTNRKIHERTLGTIDFKHRFVLLEILFLLAKNPGAYFDKDKLAKSIWKDEYNPLIHDKLIYTSVSRLRKLIEPKIPILNNEAEKTPRRKYILRGKDGYTFNPRVKIRFHSETKYVSEKMIANVEITSPV
jgi:tetratricopeptide (TPR) repeat protein